MRQFLIALDQVLNTCIWTKVDGFGMADETLSARAWRLREHMQLYVWIDRLFFWQEDHCRESYVSEILRRHSPREYVKMRGRRA